MAREGLLGLISLHTGADLQKDQVPRPQNRPSSCSYSTMSWKLWPLLRWLYVSFQPQLTKSSLIRQARLYIVMGEEPCTSCKICEMNANMKLPKAKLAQAAWKYDAVQVHRRKSATQGQSLQAAWQGHTCQLWLNSRPKVKVCRLLGKVTPSKLWLNFGPKVNVCRLLGKVTPSILWLNA